MNPKRCTLPRLVKKDAAEQRRAAEAVEREARRMEREARPVVVTKAVIDENTARDLWSRLWK